MTCHKFLSLATKQTVLHKEVKKIEIKVKVPIGKVNTHLYELVYKTLYTNSLLTITKNPFILLRWFHANRWKNRILFYHKILKYNDILEYHDILPIFSTSSLTLINTTLRLR